MYIYTYIHIDDNGNGDDDDDNHDAYLNKLRFYGGNENIFVCEKQCG
jgi:hypothetical protein